MTYKSLYGQQDSELGFTPEQIELLAKIHILARQMEALNNSGKAHAIIALIEEFSNKTISLAYVMEKLRLLFGSECFL